MNLRLRLTRTDPCWLGRALSMRYVPLGGRQMLFDHPETGFRECWLMGTWAGSVHRDYIGRYDEVSWTERDIFRSRTLTREVQPFDPGRLLGPKKLHHVAWALEAPGRERHRLCDYSEVS